MNWPLVWSRCPGQTAAPVHGFCPAVELLHSVRYKSKSVHVDGGQVFNWNTLKSRARTDGDLTDAAVEGSRGGIVAATAGFTICEGRTRHM